MRKKALKHQFIYFWKEKKMIQVRACTWAYTHKKHFEDKPISYFLLFGRLLIIILMLFRSWMFFSLSLSLSTFFLSFVVHHLALGKVPRDSSYSSETTPNMFLWSAYMNNEKTFVIEILVVRVFYRERDLCDSSNKTIPFSTVNVSSTLFHSRTLLLLYSLLYLQ